MPIYVTNTQDRAIILHAADGETIQIPPKTRDVPINRKFSFAVPTALRLKDTGEVARHEREHVVANEPELATKLKLAAAEAPATPAPAAAAAAEAPTPPAPVPGTVANPPASSGTGTSSSGAPPPGA